MFLQKIQIQTSIRGKTEWFEIRDIKSNSIHFPFLRRSFDVLKLTFAFYWCLNYDQLDIFFSDFVKQLGIQISSFYRSTVRYKCLLLLF